MQKFWKIWLCTSLHLIFAGLKKFSWSNSPSVLCEHSLTAGSCAVEQGLKTCSVAAKRWPQQGQLGQDARLKSGVSILQESPGLTCSQCDWENKWELRVVQHGMAQHGMGVGRLPALQGPFPAPGEKRSWKGESWQLYGPNGIGNTRKCLCSIKNSSLPLKFTFYHREISDSLKEAGWEHYCVTSCSELLVLFVTCSPSQARARVQMWGSCARMWGGCAKVQSTCTAAAVPLYPK